MSTPIIKPAAERTGDATIVSHEALDTLHDAIAHVLRQIRERSEVGYYLGHGTESFELLTEAFALLKGKTQEEVQKLFRPRTAADPRKVTVEEAGKALWQVSHRYSPKTWGDVDKYERETYASQERSLFEDYYGLGFEAKKGGEEE